MGATNNSGSIEHRQFEDWKERVRNGEPLYPWTRLTERDVELACRDDLIALLGQPRRPGIDFGLLTCGMRYALAVLNRGVTRFPAFASEIVGTLGNAAIPYLLSWYAARWDPRFLGGPVDSDAVAESYGRTTAR